MTIAKPHPQKGEFYIVARDWRCHTQGSSPEIMVVIEKIRDRNSYLMKLLHYPEYNSTGTDRRGHAVLSFTPNDHVRWVRVDNIMNLIDDLLEGLNIHNG